MRRVRYQFGAINIVWLRVTFQFICDAQKKASGGHIPASATAPLSSCRYGVVQNICKNHTIYTMWKRSLRHSWLACFDAWRLLVTSNLITPHKRVAQNAKHGHMDICWNNFISISFAWGINKKRANQRWFPRIGIWFCFNVVMAPLINATLTIDSVALITVLKTQSNDDWCALEWPIYSIITVVR